MKSIDSQSLSIGSYAVKQFASRLDEIEGLGPKRKMLLKEFKSLKNITAATTEELQEIGLPKNVAQNVFDKLHQE